MLKKRMLMPVMLYVVNTVYVCLTVVKENMHCDRFVDVIISFIRPAVIIVISVIEKNANISETLLLLLNPQ